MKFRRAGVLVPVLSLPSAHGIGDFGPAAYRWIDWLHGQKQTVWQILPLNITGSVTGYSPYSSLSAYAINPVYISPELLVKQGYLKPGQIRKLPEDNPGEVDYPFAGEFKARYLNFAYQVFSKKRKKEKAFQIFCHEHSGWLEDFALFTALREQFALRPWNQWPEEFRSRESESLDRFAGENARRLEEIKFWQFLLFEQWKNIKDYAASKGVIIFGDMPIYVEHDSADVWANPRYFVLGRGFVPKVVAGVPPDYFSETGQRWGNPVYDWKKLKEDGYRWWVRRLKYNLTLYDYVRIDHFRGLVQFWQIPAKESTAVNGRWKKVPVFSFMKELRSSIPRMPIIAEDLGIITDDVKAVMKRYKLPGMKILLFAFGGNLVDHPYLPHNYDSLCLVYTGTHDNNTVRGWYRQEAQGHEKFNLSNYLNKILCEECVHWDLIEMAYRSPANWAVIPLQDLLGLGPEARMNTPGTTRGNWRWRMKEVDLTPDLAARVRELTLENKRF
jgi:4-alpha-glucanotransferase